MATVLAPSPPPNLSASVAELSSCEIVPLIALADVVSGMPQLSLAQFEAMIAAGVFHEDDRVELLNGWLVKSMAPLPPHTAITITVLLHLAKTLPDGWHPRQENPICLDETGSQPEPDIAIVRGTAADYAAAHPTGSDLAAVIEVSDTTRRRDDVKAVLYAAAGIPQYLIIDMPSQTLVEHTRPVDGRYQRIEVVESMTIALDDADGPTITQPMVFPETAAEQDNPQRDEPQQDELRQDESGESV